jgi:hypothetical protein
MMMKAQATLTKNLANTAVTAAVVATLKKVLDTRKVL